MANRDTHIGAVGNHADTPQAGFTRPANTTAYAVGQLIANSIAAGSVAPLAFLGAREADIAAAVRRVRVRTSDTQFFNATVRVHLYRNQPAAANGDGGAWSSNDSEYLGGVDVTMDQQFTDPCVKGIGVPNAGSEITFLPSVGQQAIYGLIEARSAIATPASASTWAVTLEILQN